MCVHRWIYQGSVGLVDVVCGMTGCTSGAWRDEPNGASATVHGRRVERQTQNASSNLLPLCADVSMYVQVYVRVYVDTEVDMYLHF